jgi:hypothetical protein
MGLADLLRTDGFTSLSEAVGAGQDRGYAAQSSPVTEPIGAVNASC